MQGICTLHLSTTNVDVFLQLLTVKKCYTLPLFTFPLHDITAEPISERRQQHKGLRSSVWKQFSRICKGPIKGNSNTSHLSMRPLRCGFANAQVALRQIFLQFVLKMRSSRLNLCSINLHLLLSYNKGKGFKTTLHTVYALYDDDTYRITVKSCRYTSTHGHLRRLDQVLVNLTSHVVHHI